MRCWRKILQGKVACSRFSLLLSAGKLVGVFTDGDLCRIIDHKLHSALVKEVRNAG